MYTRSLLPPKRSFLLLGPRAVGKSTWLRQHFAQATTFNLLHAGLRLALLRAPGELGLRVRAQAPGSWVVIDEVQLVPDILHEVHDLIEDGGYKFALSGSSARKIKRGQANLLAGRALQKRMFPLTLAEMGDVGRLGDCIERGGLPLVVDGGEEWADVLEAYCMTYLREEIQAEALARNLSNFSRFLECAALANAQVTNIAGLSRDAGVQRPTVQGYFQVLEDTLVGHFLPAWRPRARMKEQAHPKFYWFDAGVARTMAGRVRVPVDAQQTGALLETWILHELRAHIHHAQLGGELSYWRTPSGTEVDFIWSRAGTSVGIEVKASRRWKGEWAAGLLALDEATTLHRTCAVYLGDVPLNDRGIQVLPLAMFLEALYEGKILA